MVKADVCIKNVKNDNILQRRNTLFIDNDFEIKKLPDYKVYKHNDLVECKSNFSAIEHRIIVLAIAQILYNDEKLKMYKIPIQHVLGNKKHTSNYNLVRNAVQKLHKSTIEMQEEDGWKSYAFVSKAQGKYGQNFIEIQFHEDIQKFLLGLKSQYTTYTLANVINFKRNNSLRIYELCKQYSKIGSRVMDLEYLKKLLSLENKHKDFCDFKRYVLNPSLEEINRHSDIEVDFAEKRVGRKVKTIQFFINKKQDIGEITSLAECSVALENRDNLEKLGFDTDEINVMRKEYGEDRLSGVLSYYEKHIDEVKFPKPWIQKALKENYVDSHAYKEAMEKKKTEKEEKSLKEEELRKEIEEKREAIGNIEEAIEQAEKDIEYYQNTGKLKSGDVMRFEIGLSVEKAIEIMRNRIQNGKDMIESLHAEIKKLEFY